MGQSSGGISDHVWTIVDLLPEKASATKRTKKPTPVLNYGQEPKKLSTSNEASVDSREYHGSEQCFELGANLVLTAIVRHKFMFPDSRASGRSQHLCCCFGPCGAMLASCAFIVLYSSRQRHHLLRA